MKIVKYFVLLSTFICLATAMEKPVGNEDQIQTIIKKYNLSPNRCRIAINREIVFKGYERNLEIACLIAGLKDIYWAQGGAKELATMDPIFKELLEPLNIQYIILDNGDLIMYTPQGERSALLFAKNRAIKNDLSAYLTGKLLGYKEDDIKYHELYLSFIRWYGDLLNEPIAPRLNVGDFPNWPDKDKEFFKEFETKVWPQTPRHQQFQEEKKRAIDWINQNNVFSNDDLKKQIAPLVKELSASKISKTESKSSIDWPSLWKRGR